MINDVEHTTPFYYILNGIFVTIIAVMKMLDKSVDIFRLKMNRRKDTSSLSFGQKTVIFDLRQAAFLPTEGSANDLSIC